MLRKRGTNLNSFINAKIVEKKILVEGVVKMTFETEKCNFTAPGQYATIKIDENGLECSFTVCEYDSNRFTLVFRVSDDASEELSAKELGDIIQVETGLGNGYVVDIIPDEAVLVADSNGVPGMLGLLRELIMKGKSCRLVLGYPSKDGTFMIDTFRNLCSNIEVLTADGSNGRQGNADDGIRKVDYVCASGSIDMLDRLAKKAKAGQFNLDGMNVTKW